MKKLLCVVLAALLLSGVTFSVFAQNLDDPDGQWGAYADPNEQESGVSVTDSHFGEAYSPAEDEEASQPEAPKTAASSGSVKKPEVKWTYGVSLTALQSPYLVLVNAENLLDESYEPQVRMKMNKLKRTSSTTWFLEEAAGLALTSMFEGALAVTSYTYSITEKDGTVVFKTAEFPKGMTLYLESAYRSYGTQKTSYYNRLERNNGVDDGYVAKPGASEHQTGLCADILDYSYRDKAMNEGFALTPEAQWMKENCATYGFVLRYPKDKEEITGIKYEPWHFRYVGEEVARYMTDNNLCLEEFTVEYQEAIADFISRGGNIEEQLKFESYHLDMPPESTILNEFDEQGDPEISLVF